MYFVILTRLVALRSFSQIYDHFRYELVDA